MEGKVQNFSQKISRKGTNLEHLSYMEDHIKMYYKKTVCEVVDLIHLVQDTEKW
jgi:hypothetical protein